MKKKYAVINGVKVDITQAKTIVNTQKGAFVDGKKVKHWWEFWK